MNGLLYKELVQNKRQLLLLLPTMLVIFTLPFMMMIDPSLPGEELSSMQGMMGTFCYILAFFMLNVSQQELMKSDENKRWAAFTASSPKGVRGLVAAKYELVLLMDCIITWLCLAVDQLSAAVGGVTSIGSVVYTNLFYLHLFLSAFDLPFMLRFGAKAGAVYRAALFLGLLAFAIVYGLFGDLSKFGSMDDLWGWLLPILQGEEMPDGLFAVLALSPYVSVIAYYLSYRISCRVYLKGAEHYDK